MMNKKLVVISTVIAAIIVILVISTIPNSPPKTNEKLGLVINTPGPTTPQQLDQIYAYAASAGIGRSNVYMFWNLIEPQQENFNWNQTDLLMNLNEKNDLKVTLYFSLINGRTLGPFPDWITASSLKTIPQDNLIATLDAVLSRYDIIDSVIISGGTDSQFRYNEQNIPIYKNLFDDIYDKIKAKHPNVQIGNAYALHNVLNKNLSHIVEESSFGDFVAFSYFPVDSLNDIVKSPIEAANDLDKALELVPEKKIALFEVGWSTSDFVDGNQTDQAQFLGLVLKFLVENKDRLEFATWYRQFDKPEGSCVVNPEDVEGTVGVGGASGLGSSEYVAQRLEHYICSSGLIDYKGNTKPAWREFQNFEQLMQ